MTVLKQTIRLHVCMNTINHDNKTKCEHMNTSNLQFLWKDCVWRCYVVDLVVKCSKLMKRWKRMKSDADIFLRHCFSCALAAPSGSWPWRAACRLPSCVSAVNGATSCSSTIRRTSQSSEDPDPITTWKTTKTVIRHDIFFLPRLKMYICVHVFPVFLLLWRIKVYNWMSSSP